MNHLEFEPSKQNLRMWKKPLLALVLLAFVTVCAVQQRKLNSLNARLDVLQAGPNSPARSQGAGTNAGQSRNTIVRQALTDSDVYVRLGSLEDDMGELLKLSDYLMEYGRVPLADRKVDEVVQRLGNPTLSDQERLRALRLLRSGNELNSQAVTLALNWLSGATNANLRDNILRQMEGVTNSALQAPLIQFALNDPDSDVREQAVDNLRRYIADPQVEEHLWAVLRNETDTGVRQEAMNALTRGPVSDARLALLESRTLNPEATLDERMVALQALRRANAEIPQTMAALAQWAYESEDKAERVRLFDAFDGFSDPSLKVPLVYGLQDPSPEVRERAADALSSFRSDAAVQEWLKYIAQNDDDPRVRREASRALGGRAP